MNNNSICYQKNRERLLDQAKNRWQRARKKILWEQ